MDLIKTGLNGVFFQRQGLIEEYSSTTPECRYMLKRAGTKTLFCIGQNPSYGSVFCTLETVGKQGNKTIHNLCKKMSFDFRSILWRFV